MVFPSNAGCTLAKASSRALASLRDLWYDGKIGQAQIFSLSRQAVFKLHLHFTGSCWMTQRRIGSMGCCGTPKCIALHACTVTTWTCTLR